MAITKEQTLRKKLDQRKMIFFSTRPQVLGIFGCSEMV